MSESNLRMMLAPVPDAIRALDLWGGAAGVAVLLLDLHDDDPRVALLPGRVAPRWGQAAVGADTGEESVSAVDVVHAVHTVQTVAVVVPVRKRGTDHYAVERHRVTVAADRKSTRLNSSHAELSRMPSSA